jgi:glycine cleavage system H lipoate-binding protein
MTGRAHERRVIVGLRFALEFRWVNLVDASTVDIPVSQAAESSSTGLASEVDAGEQAGTTVEEDARDESWLYQLTYGDEQEEEA